MEPRVLEQSIPVEEFAEIRTYLETHNLGVNKYRVKVGEGVSQCFGIVGKRCMPPDLSRQSWLHPQLHHLLVEFGKKYLPPGFTYTSIQVNVDFPCKLHKDIGNIGDSCIFLFGPFIGGALEIEGRDYFFHQRGLLFDGSQMEHQTKPWVGHRFALVYHTLAPLTRWHNQIPSIDDYEALVIDGHWKIRRKSDGELFWSVKGLPHPLRGRKKI